MQSFSGKLDVFNEEKDYCFFVIRQEDRPKLRGLRGIRLDTPTIPKNGDHVQIAGHPIQEVKKDGQHTPPMLYISNTNSLGINVEPYVGCDHLYYSAITVKGRNKTLKRQKKAWG